jgi:Protein of unknown function (DUF2878)
MHSILNAIGFQSAWWACVLAAGRGLDRFALAYGAVLALLHLYWSDQRPQELRLACWVMFMGIGVDTLLQAFGVIHFQGWALGPLSPLWLWMLWLLFGMTLNASLAFLKNKPLILSAALGAMLGPVNYIAGAQAGAASLAITPAHVTVLSLCWLLALPTMVWAAQKLSPLRTSAHP